MNSRCTINQLHCENCGSTDPYDVEDLADTDGYTRCCNECRSYGPNDCRGFHCDWEILSKL